jgi:hypothetical protein
MQLFKLLASGLTHSSFKFSPMYLREDKKAGRFRLEEQEWYKLFNKLVS